MGSTKKIVALAIFLLTTLMALAQAERYSRVKIRMEKRDMLRLAELGVNLESAFLIDSQSLILEISEQETALLRSNQFDIETLVEDLTLFYVERNLLPESKTDLHSGTAPNTRYPIPQGFALGMLGGFSTYDECMDHLDNMHANYPELITSRMALGPYMTQEGRPVYLVKITNQSIMVDKAKVLYTGMIHAREPIAMQHLLYYMYYLLENYHTDPAIKYLLDFAELYIVPILNPDGYIYNQQIAPNGGGMWRKNRRINGGDAFGVDLNRNFAFMWGYDNTGSSPLPNNDIYRGPEPFSEPESLMIKELCESVNFSIALNYHSYSNLLLVPWGYIKAPTPDNELYISHARLMTRDNAYITGQSSVILYLNNGGTDDWMYGEQTSKPKIFAFTPEVGTTSDGFWPAINRIIPLCQENMTQSLTAGLLSLHYASVTDHNPPYLNQTTGYLKFAIQRMGFKDSGTFTVNIESLSEELIFLGEPVSHSNLALSEIIIDSIAYALNPETLSGKPIRFILSIDNGHYIMRDTITKIFGVPDTVFFDDCANMTNWTGDWGLTTQSWVSPSASITDSPAGNYPDNSNTSITVAQTIDLSGAAWAQLRFMAKWNIESDWDYAQVLVSTDNGVNWQALRGKYSKTGGSYQLPGQPVYDGNQQDWILEEIDLTVFSGSQIMIRFRLVSNLWVNADGFYFDDLEIIRIAASEILAAAFIADQNVILEGVSVHFSDQSTGSSLYREWYFEGGNPAMSNLQNPTVIYSEPGIFDVTLIISNYSGSDTLHLPDCILVLDSLLCRPVVAAGSDATILPWNNFTTYEATAENYLSLKWSTSGDGIFDNDTILYSTYTPGTIDISQQVVFLTLTALPYYEVCGGVSDTLRLNIVDFTGVITENKEYFSVFPNPGSSTLNILLPQQATSATLWLSNTNGTTLVQKEISGCDPIILDTKDLNNGIYFLRIMSNDLDHTQKIVILK